MNDLYGINRTISMGNSYNEQVAAVNRTIKAKNDLNLRNYNARKGQIIKNVSGAEQAETIDQLTDRGKEGLESAAILGDVAHAQNIKAGQLINKVGEGANKFNNAANQIKTAARSVLNSGPSRPQGDFGEPEGIELQEANIPRAGVLPGVSPGSDVARFSGRVDIPSGNIPLAAQRGESAESLGIQATRPSIGRFLGTGEGEVEQEAGAGRVISQPSVGMSGNRPATSYETPEPTDFVPPADANGAARAALVAGGDAGDVAAASAAGSAAGALSEGAEASGKASTLSNALRVANVVGGAIDLGEDLKSGKFKVAGDNRADRISNVAGMISAGTEVAGTALDATGVGAVIGVPLQALGAVAGGVGLISGVIGDVMDEGKGKKAVKQAKAATAGPAPTPQKGLAYTPIGLTGAYAGKVDNNNRIQGTGAF